MKSSAVQSSVIDEHYAMNPIDHAPLAAGVTATDGAIVARRYAHDG